MSREVVVLLFAFAIMASLFSTEMVVADDCSGDLLKLGADCADFVQISGPQVDPSSACCDVVKEADVPCVCEQITPAIEELISVKKVAYVAEKCGRPLQSGSKCGSFTVPKA